MLGFLFPLCTTHVSSSGDDAPQGAGPRRRTRLVLTVAGTGLVALAAVVIVMLARGPSEPSAGAPAGVTPETVENAIRYSGHDGRVYAIDFSPDGLILASGGSDQTVRLWDVPRPGQTSDDVSEEVGIFKAEHPVRHLLFHPGGVFLALSCGDNRGRKAEIHVCDLSRQTCEKKLTQKGSAPALAFSPDGELLAAQHGKHLRLFTFPDFEPKTRLEQERETPGIAFGPDGARLAAGGYDDAVALWDVAGGTVVRRFEGHERAVYDVAFSPDGQRLVSASADGSARIWDVTTGKALTELEGHMGKVKSVAFSPTGVHIATGGRDSAVHLWDATSGESLGVLPGHGKSVSDLVFSPDGSLLASASKDRTVRVWRIGAQ